LFVFLGGSVEGMKRLHFKRVVEFFELGISLGTAESVLIHLVFFEGLSREMFVLAVAVGSAGDIELWLCDGFSDLAISELIKCKSISILMLELLRILFV
jgi:hypothetical protein